MDDSPGVKSPLISYNPVEIIEFSENKQCLEEITNSKVWSMSHPSGSYSEETLSILKELSISIGFRADVEKYRDHSNLECPRIDHTILINKYL